MPTTPAQVRDLLTAYGLDDYADLVLASLTPSVRLVTQPAATVPTGASKLGGEPDLPADAPWPTNKGRPMHFLAQVTSARSPAAGHPCSLPPAASGAGSTPSARAFTSTANGMVTGPTP